MRAGYAGKTNHVIRWEKEGELEIEFNYMGNDLIDLVVGLQGGGGRLVARRSPWREDCRMEIGMPWGERT